MQKDQSIISGAWQAEGKTSDGARESVRTKAAKALTALKAAVTDARAQAKILAKEAGAKLGDVVTISGDGVSYPYSYRTQGLSAIDAAEIQNDNSDITIGEEEITATISVTYQLR